MSAYRQQTPNGDVYVSIPGFHPFKVRRMARIAAFLLTQALSPAQFARFIAKFEESGITVTRRKGF